MSAASGHHTPANVAFGPPSIRRGVLWLAFTIGSKSRPGVVHYGGVRSDGTGAQCSCGAPNGCTLERSGPELVRTWHRRRWLVMPSHDIYAFDRAYAEAIARGPLSEASVLEVDSVGDVVAARLAEKHGVATGRAA